MQMVSQNYGHNKSINKKKIIGLVPKKKNDMLEKYSTFDPNRAPTTIQKFDALEQKKDQTKKRAVARVETQLAQHVTETQ